MDHALAFVILALSLLTAALKVRSLLGTYRSAARWESGSPTGSNGSNLRFKAFGESMQVAPWHPADRLTWAYSSEAREEFRLKQAATADGLRAAAEAADYADRRECALRATVVAERRASLTPDAVVLSLALVIAILSSVVALT